MARYELRIDPDGELVEVWDQQGKLIGYMRDEAVGSNGVMAMLRAGKKMEADLGEGVSYDDVDWRTPGPCSENVFSVDAGMFHNIKPAWVYMIIKTDIFILWLIDHLIEVGRNAKIMLWPELKETHE